MTIFCVTAICLFTFFSLIIIVIAQSVSDLALTGHVTDMNFFIINCDAQIRQ